MIEPVETSVDPTRFELVVRTKNGPGKPVYREDLPKVLFGRAPRLLLGSSWFDRYTKGKNPGICQGCGSHRSTERHELYSLWRDKETLVYVIRLDGIQYLCPTCHQKIHGGFSNRMNMKYGFVNDPVPVSDVMSSKYPWNFAKYMWVDDKLYLL